MSTWLDDMKRSDPKLYSAYRIVGNQDRISLRNMVHALSKCAPWLNTEEDTKRLEAAQYILKRRKP